MKPVTKIPHIVHGGDYNPDQWLDYPEVLREDVRLMKLAGINSATVAIFAWNALEPEEGQYRFEWLDKTMDRLFENGIYTILATPSGARPAWMDKKYPEICRVDENGVRHTHGQRHNHCYTNPVYREKVRQMNTLLAERYAGHPGMMMWHVSNEYGGACWCPQCQEAFREYLRKRYHGDIHELNDAWWTGFWSRRYRDFDEIDAPSPKGEMLLHGLNVDWKRFQTYQTNEFLHAEIEPLRKANPNIPITTNFHGGLQDLNYWEMKNELDVTSWDIYPSWGTDARPMIEEAGWSGMRYDLIRSLGGGKPFFLMESAPSTPNAFRVCKLKRPGVHALSELQAVAQGSDSVQYFQWRKSRGGSEKFHGAVVDHEGTEHTRVFREVQDLGETLRKLDKIVGTEVNAKAAVIYDWENCWAVQDFQGMRKDKNYAETVLKHYQPLFEAGIPMDIVDETADISKYRLVIAPMLYMLRSDFAKKLEVFVKNGGMLITTYATGYVNEADQCFRGGFPGGGLRKVLGIWAEEIDALYDADSNRLCWQNTDFRTESTEIRHFCEIVHTEGAEVLAYYGEDFYKGMPAVTYNHYGMGSAIHIACDTDAAMLREFYAEVLHIAGLEPPISNLPREVVVRVREDEENRYLFVMNFSEGEKTAEVPQGYELTKGRKVEGKMILEPYSVRIIEIKK